MQNKKSINVDEKITTQKNIFRRIFDYVWGICKKIFCCKKNNLEEEKKIRENLSEKKIDKMIKDSFPASDPPSTY